MEDISHKGYNTYPYPGHFWLMKIYLAKSECGENGKTYLIPMFALYKNR